MGSVDMQPNGIPLFSRSIRKIDLAGEHAESARTIETCILRALAEVSQSTIASSTGISETRLSRFKNAAIDGGGLQLPEVAAVLAALGLTIFNAQPSEGLVTIPVDELAALRTLALKGIATWSTP